jgi:hypothetical protein
LARAVDTGSSRRELGLLEGADFWLDMERPLAGSMDEIRPPPGFHVKPDAWGKPFTPLHLLA